jgi:hypothetical protein
MRHKSAACRLSFSPLGDQLAIVNATDGDLCTFMLSERQSWRCDKHCVGHEGTIVAARYAPRVFRRPGTGDSGADHSRGGADKRDEDGDDVATVRGTDLLAVHQLSGRAFSLCGQSMHLVADCAPCSCLIYAACHCHHVLSPFASPSMFGC